MDATVVVLLTEAVDRRTSSQAYAEALRAVSAGEFRCWSSSKATSGTGSGFGRSALAARPRRAGISRAGR